MSVKRSLLTCLLYSTSPILSRSSSFRLALGEYHKLCLGGTTEIGSSFNSWARKILGSRMGQSNIRIR
jgi:hypothetical protein